MCLVLQAAHLTIRAPGNGASLILVAFPAAAAAAMLLLLLLRH
jgi:hypothetical protein